LREPRDAALGSILRNGILSPSQAIAKSTLTIRCIPRYRHVGRLQPFSLNFSPNGVRLAGEDAVSDIVPASAAAITAPQIAAPMFFTRNFILICSVAEVSRIETVKSHRCFGAEYGELIIDIRVNAFDENQDCAFLILIKDAIRYCVQFVIGLISKAQWGQGATVVVAGQSRTIYD
jgi:hypothetical protein